MNDTPNIRLPLDLLLLHDAESLETEGLTSKYALEFELELYFCHGQSDVDDMVEEHGEDNVNWYEIDTIEHDRIRAIVDLLTKAEEDSLLGHIVDRIIR